MAVHAKKMELLYLSKSGRLVYRYYIPLPGGEIVSMI